MTKPLPSRSILKSLDANGKQAFVLQNFYCGPMDRMGKCTRICSTCQDNLDDIFKTARSVENPRNPDAVLTYVTREKIAQIEEEGEMRKPFPVTWLGENDDRNPFELFLENL